MSGGRNSNGVTTTNERPLACPFVVVVDAQEKAPFSFAGLRADSKQRNRPLVVQTRWESLGVASGDYSIAGYEPKRTDAPARVAIERKSIEDLVGTVTGFKTERRARFERELANLATLDSAVVICEGSLDACLRHCSESEHGSATLGKIFHRSVIALQQDYRVAWLFCDSRRLAEITAFRWLERFHNKTQERLAAASECQWCGQRHMGGPENCTASVVGEAVMG